MHTENQDSFLADQSNSLFAIADGVGGYAGAKQASELAIDGLKEREFMLSDDTSTFEMVLREIHEEIEQRAERQRMENMGTTIAVAKVFPKDAGGGSIITANVGDSPILFFPCHPGAGETCVQAYTDDSYRDKFPSSMAAIIQYLGLPDWDIQVHTKKFQYSSGDMLLICSDGVTDNLADRGHKDRNPWSKLEDLVKNSRSAQRIAESAIAAGIKPDDMTAILLQL